MPVHLGGIGLIGVAGYVNVLHTRRPSDMQIVVVAAAGTALALVFFLDVAGPAGLAALALVGVIAGELYGFVATSERLLFARDHRQSAVATSNQVGAAQGSTDYAVSAAKTGCASGRGRRRQRQRLICTNDPGGTQVPVEPNCFAAIMGLNPLIVDLILTLAGSVALNLLGFVMMTFGHATRRVNKPVVSAQFRPSRRQRRDHPVVRALLSRSSKLQRRTRCTSWETKGEASKKRGEVRDLLIEQKIGRRTVIDPNRKLGVLLVDTLSP